MISIPRRGYCETVICCRETEILLLVNANNFVDIYLFTVLERKHKNFQFRRTVLAYEPFLLPVTIRNSSHLVAKLLRKYWHLEVLTFMKKNAIWPEFLVLQDNARSILLSFPKKGFYMLLFLGESNFSMGTSTAE